MKYRSYTIFLLLLFATFITNSCSKKGNISIEGNWPEGAGTSLSLEMLNIAQTNFIDSAKVDKKGRFEFHFDLQSPEIVILKNHANKNINLLAFPGDEIVLNIPGNSFQTGYEVKGSDESEKIRLLVEDVQRTIFRLDSITAAIDSLDDPDSPRAEVLASAYRQIFQDQKRNNIKFIVQNINSLASVYALYQRVAPDIYLLNTYRDLQYFKIVSDSVQVKYPESTLANSLSRDVKKRIADYNSMMFLNKLSKQNIVETGLINLKMETVGGDSVELKSLYGKVILLQFWASWDRDSREAARSLRSVYNRYHNKGFEVFAVSLDREKSSWRSAIDFEELHWINVSELSFPYSYAASVYNVRDIPVNFLIDREGNIVAKNIYGKTLSTWLDNLL